MTTILYNPLANGGKGELGVDEVKAALAPEDPVVTDITSLDTRAFLEGLSADDKVVLCGGDGTIHRLVNDLAGTVPGVPIHVWRFGTGNDFLRDVTVDMPDPNVRSVLLNRYLGNLPAAHVGTKTLRYVNGCSCGVDAVVCGMMEENRLAPKQSGYAVTALRSFFKRYQPMSGRVTVDGETRSYDRIWMAASMNGRFQGGGMRFAPDQDRNGSTLTCMVWHDTSALGTLLRFPFVIPGRHTGFPACDMRVGREIVVELDAPTMIQLDGEVIDGVTGYTAVK